MPKSTLEAVVEKLLLDIKDENTAYISKTLSADSDRSLWLSALRYEVPIISLMDGLLDADIVLPRLVVCGVRTLAPLHYAALRGTDSILREFKTTQISPDTPLSGGSTALQFACFSGYLSTVKLLLDEWKADLGKKDVYGWSPLHYASIGGQLEVVEELCRRGVNIVERDQDGTTPCYRAQTFGHEAIVEFFKNIWKGDQKELFEIRQSTPQSDGQQTDALYSAVTKQIPAQRKPNNNKCAKASAKNDSIVTPANDAAKAFIKENVYDIPDDLVTRIQCKYEPNSNVYSNSTNQSAVYDQPYEPQGLTPKEKSKKKIQELVKNQLQEVFETDDTYLQANSTDLYDTIGPHSDIPNIGFKTLKYLLRSEFQKYKSSGFEVGRSKSLNSGSTSAAAGAAGTLDERNIYEDIVKGTVNDRENKWVKGGQTIRLKLDQNPPPLPPRNSILNEQTFKQDDPDKPSDSFNKEFKRASTCLNLIEETQLVREACFNELLQVLGPGDWQKLALALPLRQNTFLTKEKIKTIEKQYPKDRGRQAKAALQDWNKHFGKNATLESLVNAMKKCGFVEKIKTVEAANKKG